MEAKRDLTDFVYNKFKNKTLCSKPNHTNYIQKEYFKKLNINMIKKSQERIENIKRRIINDINKNSFNKKYQIKSFYEYKLIKDFCKSYDMKGYELLYHHDDNIKTNKLDKIIEGDYDCCKDCDRPMKFINKKVLVMYCYFYKN